ncbi:recombination regulator RecX [Mycobacterium sp. 1274756.6]|uniref:recombination regulator RecX n=1 Tax=Mycobacterium sp. 1274756.6 TaxID=1834076 RepID=UPI00080247CA|nr:recombination regulator RecX [Mycobacterium sp. 1274756.6]OBJ74237.1 recombination regulator RecX [Mycobacterium sp. 1274756.6]
MTSCPPPSTSEREEQARTLCLRLLTARARSRAELTAQLARRGYPEEVATRVLDRLAAAGLVDDAAFAEQWVRSRHRYAGRGRRALAAELRRKGIDEEVAAGALGEVDAAAERGRAEELVGKRLRRENLDGDPLKIARRLVAMLARRGYHQTLAYDVVRTAIAAEQERRRV